MSELVRLKSNQKQSKSALLDYYQIVKSKISPMDPLIKMWVDRVPYDQLIHLLVL